MTEKIDLTSLPYRPCVGIMLINKMGQVFVGERIDTPEAWQMPQGGIDAGEDPLRAAYRELQEETGVQAPDVILLDQSADWLFYDLPAELLSEGKLWRGRYRGQKQQWFLMQLNTDDSAISIDGDPAEFARWQWVAIDDITGLIVPFKRDIYAQLVEEFGPIIDTIIQAQST